MRQYLYATASILAAVSMLPGCLSNVHKIPQSELHRLAQAPPADRGRSVKVVQQFAGNDGPPPAERVDGNVRVGVYVGVDTRPTYTPRPRGRAGDAAKAAKEDAKVLIVLAALAAVGLAVTEGARFIGDAELHPMHPVHLFGWDGGYVAIPLAHIRPEDAQWARKAVIRESEGPMRRLRRAPLDRTGLTYSVLFGQGEVGASQAALNSEGLVGFASHIQLGVFPTHQVGLLYDLSFQFTDDREADTVFDVRNSFELQFMPASSGRFHAGGFAQVGYGRRLDDALKGSDLAGVTYGGGAMLQLGVTTTLAITGRAGVNVVFGQPIRDFTVGVSIY